MAAILNDPEVQYSDRVIANAVGVHISATDRFSKDTSTLINDLGDLAAILQNAGKQKDVESLTKQVYDLVGSKHDLELLGASLQDLKQSYRATGESTNFTNQITSRMEALDEATPYTVDNDPEFVTFKATIEDEQEPQEEQIDDDIAIEGGNSIAKNEKCPISGKPILELANPVQDSHGIVYEKSVIEGYMKTCGQCPCPMAGTSHTVRLTELVPAVKVIAAQKKAQRQKARGGGGLTQLTQRAGQEVHEID